MREKISWACVYASIFCFLVLISVYFYALAVFYNSIWLDYVAGAACVGGVLFFALGVLIYPHN